MLCKTIAVAVPVLCALILCQAGAGAEGVPKTAPESPLAIASSRQLLLVTTKDWNAVTGVMRRFARADASSGWNEVGAGIPVVVGRNGLGWGRGLSLPFALPGPVKKEGDG
ncbi:MAG: hypothetical protein JWQ04_2700, partial [Pedosphaera sp.]|nr:hypothetical protein [Pedosphaera sp.]